MSLVTRPGNVALPQQRPKGHTKASVVVKQPSRNSSILYLRRFFRMLHVSVSLFTNPTPSVSAPYILDRLDRLVFFCFISRRLTNITSLVSTYECTHTHTHKQSKLSNLNLRCSTNPKCQCLISWEWDSTVDYLSGALMNSSNKSYSLYI